MSAGGMAPARRAAGQSTTEFLIVFPLLVMLVFGIIQFALIYQARATLNYATMLAARAGALNNGDETKMRLALGSGLAPLFATDPSYAGYGKALGLGVIETSKISNMVRVDVLNPTKAAMSDFGRQRLDGLKGMELPSDTLSYRTSTAGAKSKISVQDANILHVRVSYCFRLVVPVMDRIIYAGYRAITPNAAVLSANGMSDPFGTGGFQLPTTECLNPLMRGPRITIRSEAMVRMQSPFYETNMK
ncbi:TadE/TadG family type IV pilus assembly protein [Janthinobacterium sp. 64]|uniref:TadE/TadG family type IV pilus assembly protein n=1 Tax=Janthinobacterium sp. 64 TaxID=2035208 RepID=UPI000C2C8870|nr:TadE family protein [Janthinobacterium sp. 64]PKB21244.1 TadE-like protein [Janthinobacterium sp. 64]